VNASGRTVRNVSAIEPSMDSSFLPSSPFHHAEASCDKRTFVQSSIHPLGRRRASERSESCTLRLELPSRYHRYFQVGKASPVGGCALGELSSTSGGRSDGPSDITVALPTSLHFGWEYQSGHGWNIVRSLVSDLNSHSDCDEADNHDGKSTDDIWTGEFDYLRI